MLNEEIYNRLRHDAELQARIVLITKRIYLRCKSFQTVQNWIKKKDSRLEHPYIMEFLAEYTNFSKIQLFKSENKS